jgi:hypothetical protein
MEIGAHPNCISSVFAVWPVANQCGFHAPRRPHFVAHTCRVLELADVGSTEGQLFDVVEKPGS